jgi:hypothetical protein
MVPIKSITRKSTSDRFVYQNDSPEPGPCARLLAGLLENIYKGKAEDKFDWLTKVQDPDIKINENSQSNPTHVHGEVTNNGDLASSREVSSNGDVATNGDATSSGDVTSNGEMTSNGDINNTSDPKGSGEAGGAEALVEHAGDKSHRKVDDGRVDDGRLGGRGQDNSIREIIADGQLDGDAQPTVKVN